MPPGTHVMLLALFVLNFAIQSSIIYIFKLMTDDPAYDDETYGTCF